MIIFNNLPDENIAVTIVCGFHQTSPKINIQEFEQKSQSKKVDWKKKFIQIKYSIH